MADSIPIRSAISTDQIPITCPISIVPYSFKPMDAKSNPFVYQTGMNTVKFYSSLQPVQAEEKLPSNSGITSLEAIGACTGCTLVVAASSEVVPPFPKYPSPLAAAFFLHHSKYSMPHIKINNAPIIPNVGAA